MMDFFEDSTGTGYQKKFEEFTSKETCQHCSKIFSNKASLKTHVLDVHLSNNKNTCKFRKHIFSSFHHMFLHGSFQSTFEKGQFI